MRTQTVTRPMMAWYAFRSCRVCAIQIPMPIPAIARQYERICIPACIQTKPRNDPTRMIIAPRGKKNRNARDMTDACAVTIGGSLLRSTKDEDPEDPTSLPLLGVVGDPEVVTNGLVVEALELVA